MTSIARTKILGAMLSSTLAAMSNTPQHTTDAVTSATTDDYQPPPPELPSQPEPPPAKHWTKSKTMWFNIAITSFGVVTSALPYAEPFLTPRLFGLLTAVIGAGNMILRAVTKKPIALADK